MTLELKDANFQIAKEIQDAINQEAWDIELDFRKRLLELEARNESKLIRSYEAY